jgi:hypothetical protein
MEKMTLKRAMDIHPLASIVLKQLGGGREAIDSAKDAARGGADGGFHGFIYHSEITPWVRRHKREIVKAMSEMADDTGVSLFDMVRSFGCFRNDTVKPTDEELGSVMYGDGSDAGDAAPMLYSAMSWFALEEVGRALADADGQ